MEKKTKEELNSVKTGGETARPKSSPLKKLGSAALAIAVAANVISPANYKTPEITLDDIQPSYVIEETIDLPPAADDELLLTDEDKQKKSARISITSIFSFIASWLLGTIAVAFPKLAAPVFTPLGTKIFSWALFALGIVLAIIIALKKAFPNTPLKEMLTGKRLLAILLLTAVIIAACEVALYYLQKYVLVIKIVSLFLGLALIIIAYKKIKNKLCSYRITLPKMSS